MALAFTMDWWEERRNT